MLIHEIETTAPNHSKAARLKIIQIIDSVKDAHGPQPTAYLNDDRAAFRVIVKGNGAFLRDLVTELDRDGFLDF